MDHIKKIITEAPKKPGVYRFKNKKGDIIYVGKAIDLRNRLRSHFSQIEKQSPKNKVMIKRVYDIEYTVVDSDLEAIMLETNLIKEIRPKYNVLMKDDKNFVYIKITIKDDYPMFYLTRKMVQDGSLYFGPKTSSYEIEQTLKLMSVFFPNKSCRLNIQRLKKAKLSDRREKRYPCMIYQIDKGHAPCISTMQKDEYKKIVDKIIDFLKEKHTELIKELQNQMKIHSEKKEFELAAKLRDQLKQIENVLEKQKIASPQDEEIDVIDLVESHGQFFVNLFQIREGKLIYQENFIIKDQENEPTKIVLEGFIKHYYTEAGSIPKTVLIPEKIDEKSEIEVWLSKLKDKKVEIIIPKIGRKHDLIKLAFKNAQSYAKQMKVKWMSDQKNDPYKAIQSLKTLLDLKKVPTRIECYDISHLAGTETVGSMVVLENGQPINSQYRIFNLKTLKKGEIDDFKSLNEVLNRRFKYITDLPKGFKLQKKKDTLTLLNKEKEPQIKFETKTEDGTTEITDIEIITNENYIKNALSELIKKLKSKKYHINPPENLRKQIESIGFIKIDHETYSHGYYPQKNLNDASFKKTPDLIIIDGGKGQLSSALEARDHYKLEIPMIGIAKRLEEIITEDKKSILLPENSPEINLIKRIRDEAHRFAITKNRKDRIKKMLTLD